MRTDCGPDSPSSGSPCDRPATTGRLPDVSARGNIRSHRPASSTSALCCRTAASVAVVHRSTAGSWHVRPRRVPCESRRAVVAIKGISGYHLACCAGTQRYRRDDVRERKARNRKPAPFWCVIDRRRYAHHRRPGAGDNTARPPASLLRRDDASWSHQQSVAGTPVALCDHLLLRGAREHRQSMPSFWHRRSGSRSATPPRTCRLTPRRRRTDRWLIRRIATAQVFRVRP